MKPRTGGNSTISVKEIENGKQDSQNNSVDGLEKTKEIADVFLKRNNSYHEIDSLPADERIRP